MTVETHTGADGAVIPFPTHDKTPATATGGEVEQIPEPIEGELLTDEENAELDARILRTKLTQTMHQLVAQVVVVGEAEKTSTAVAKAILRVVWAVLEGIRSWWRRAIDHATHGTHKQQVRIHTAAGNMEMALVWEDRLHRAQEHRRKACHDLPQTARGVAQVAVGSFAALMLLILLLSGGVAASGAGSFMSVIDGCLTMVNWTATVIRVSWKPLFFLTPVLIGIGAYREGRQHKTPGWLATAADATQVDVNIDETAIANALKALRIPAINDYLKQGLPIQFLTPARRDGRGTHAVIRLPNGVTAGMISQPNRRAQFAGSLFRAAKEVWLKTGEDEGILDIWAADKGALAEGAGPYPLLSKGTVDVFKGVPFGKTLRGDRINAPVMGRNTIVGGMPDQGKSSAARVIMVGASLDPTAELRIWIPDSNHDFQAFKDRCARYVMGDPKEVLPTILAQLRELHEEIQIRGALLVKYEIPETTRQWASKGVGLHPLFCLLEEAHVAIENDKYGPEIAQLLTDVVRLGRKRGIHMIVSTQAPTAKSIPRDVTRNCSNGIAFAVGDHVANDALLGQGAYAGGHRATELIPGADVGTALVKGFTGQRSERVQAYFLSVHRDKDQVTPIMKRAIVAVEKQGTDVLERAPLTGVETPRDFLEDVEQVLGDKTVPAADVPALLSRFAPDWAPYRRMTGKDVVAELARWRVKVASTHNRWPVDPVAVRRALAERSTQDLDAWEDLP